MPRDKDLKRIIRKRMEKTGEAYTTARAQTLRKTQDPQEEPAPSNAPAKPASRPPGESPPPDLAAVAGMSDEAVKAKTGRDWAGWVQVLDTADAAAMEHGEIARIVSEDHGVPSWWAQTVTVGYERIKGLRERGQRRDGGWEASRSRTYPVAVEALFDACADEAVRARWLSDAQPVLRTARRPKSLRLGWEDGTLVALWFTAKGPAKSSVSVQHTKLSDSETAERLKGYWSEQLDALASLLKESAG